MSIQEYISRKKEIQKDLLSLFNTEQSDDNAGFETFIKHIKEQKILEDENEFRSLLHLICSISNNHHRSPNFYNIIDKILLLFKDDFKKHLKNQEIFYIFNDNKRILLTLLQNHILEFDQNISIIIKTAMSKQVAGYFIKEIKPFLKAEFIDEIDKLYKIDENYFEENRKKGQNEKEICEIIRNDQIEDFIITINKEDIPLEMKITPSIYETNFYLLKKEPTLIEYSAFFGSIQIFTYLLRKGVKLNPSLWIYAVHGRNPEIIQLLEDNKIEPENKSYEKVYEEAVLCHHNEIAEYIKNNFQMNNNNIRLHKIISSFNYIYFPNEESLNEEYFCYFCDYDHFYLVESMLDNKIFDVEYQNHFIDTFEFIYSPLQAAVNHNNMNIVKLLINRPEIDVNSVSLKIEKLEKEKNEFEYNCLRIAIYNVNIEMLDLLLKHKKINVNSKLIYKTYYSIYTNVEEALPIGFAALHDEIKILELLLAHGQIDVNVKSVREKMVLQSGDVIELSDVNPLMMAIIYDNIDIVKLLLSHPKIDINAQSTFKKKGQSYRSDYTENLLCYLIEMKNIELIKVLLNNPKIDVNVKQIYQIKDVSCEEKPALILAVESGSEEIVFELLKHQEIDVNCKYFKNDFVNNCNEEKTVLHFAILNENENIIKLLLSNPNINVNVKSRIKRKVDEKIEIEEQTTLSYAINYGNVEILKLLLSNPELNINAKNLNLMNEFNSKKCLIEEKNLLEIANEKNPEIFQFLFEYLKDLYSKSGDKRLNRIISKFIK